MAGLCWPWISEAMSLVILSVQDFSKDAAVLVVFSGRLQVSSFFVELGPAALRSPASCPAAMSLKVP